MQSKQIGDNLHVQLDKNLVRILETISDHTQGVTVEIDGLTESQTHRLFLLLGKARVNVFHY